MQGDIKFEKCFRLLKTNNSKKSGLLNISLHLNFFAEKSLLNEIKKLKKQCELPLILNNKEIRPKYSSVSNSRDVQLSASINTEFRNDLNYRTN